MDLPGPRIAQHHLIGVLQAVEALQEYLVGGGRPVHSRDVVLPGVAVDLEPPRVAALRGDDADPGRRVGLADLGVLHGDDARVERIGVVDEIEVPHRIGVELPVGDAPSVQAPAPPVGVVVNQLFFVHPVEGPVDDRARAVGGERGDGSRREVLDVQVVLPDVSHSPSVGGELGEHQRGGLGVGAAELPRLAAGAVEHPVVTPRVEPPHRPRIGEDQQHLPVGRPRVVLDLERQAVALGHELAGRHHHPSSSRFDIVPHEVAAVAVGGGLQGGVGGAVLQPPRGTERLGGEFSGAIDPVHGEQGGVGLLGEEGGRKGGQAKTRDEAADHGRS